MDNNTNPEHAAFLQSKCLFSAGLASTGWSFQLTYKAKLSERSIPERCSKALDTFISTIRRNSCN